MERQHYKIHQHFQKKWLSCLLILFHTHTQTWQNIAIIHPMSSRCFPWYFSYFSPSQAAEVTASLSGRLIMALRDCTSKTWLSQTGMFTVTNTWYMSNDIYMYMYIYICIYIYIPCHDVSGDIFDFNHNKGSLVVDHHLRAFAPMFQVIISEFSSAAPSHLYRSPPPTAWNHLWWKPQLLMEILLILLLGLSWR